MFNLLAKKDDYVDLDPDNTWKKLFTDAKKYKDFRKTDTTVTVIVCRHKKEQLSPITFAIAELNKIMTVTHRTMPVGEYDAQQTIEKSFVSLQNTLNDLNRKLDDRMMDEVINGKR